jgi:uncharacterized protein
MELSPAAVRVLGALVEKALTTPQQYPLSESAVVVACNQTTNRDPVVRYDVDVLRPALVELRDHGLARTVHRPGERAMKHRHLLDDVLELSQAEVAVLAVLMLRGPQTLGELRIRTERLHPFAGTDEVQAVLDRLTQRHPSGPPAGPLVERLERQPGQKEARYRHLLGDRDAEPVASVAQAAAGAGGEGERPRNPLDLLADEVRELRERVAALEAELGAQSKGQPATQRAGTRDHDAHEA